MRRRSFFFIMLVCLGLALGIRHLQPGMATSAAEQSWQSLEFRLTTIERRIDMLQNRIDAVERDQRQASLQSATAPSALTESVLELRRQQTNQEREIILLQQRLLEMQKRLDRLTGAPGEEKKEAEKEKPAAPARRRP